jgi:signal transduction histidine kinase
VNAAVPPFGRHSSGERLFIALVVLTAIAGAIAYAVINGARENGRASFNARTEVAALVQLALDQETGVRGFTQTRDVVFLDPYIRASVAYPGALTALLRDVRHAPPSVRTNIEKFDQTHKFWVRTILVPLIGGRERDRSALFLSGKDMVDTMRADAAAAQDELLAGTNEIGETINRAIILSIGSIVFLTIVLGALALSYERSRFASEQQLRGELADRNASLERSNAMLEQFAHVTSHDLQEPLRTVANFTQLLQQRYAGRLDAEADEFIGFALDGARRMQGLIDDILAYSRVTTRGSSLMLLPLEIPLNRALMNLRTLIAERDVRIVRPDALPEVFGDATQLEQLFSNVIGNGIKYNTSAQPRIEISAESAGGVVRVSVKDNGIGIAAADYDRIFTIFTRLHTRLEYAGTGLGLALAQRIVEAHGGRIWVDSVEGEGSTFHFMLRDAKEALT